MINFWEGNRVGTIDLHNAFLSTSLTCLKLSGLSSQQAKFSEVLMAVKQSSNRSVPALTV